MNRHDDGDDPTLRATTHFPRGQLQRALEAALRHDDPELRRRAEQRALAWEEVVTGIATGSLQVGSRTPLENTPSWVTLDVAHGGFATGRYAAEGAVLDWERSLLDALPVGYEPDLGPRHRLNSWYLTDDGLAELTARLKARTYDVTVAEEGALLVVAWLMANGFEGPALDLVAELFPLVDRLRFYPEPTEQPVVGGAVVHRQTAGEVAAKLRRVAVPEPVDTMRAALNVWNPLHDRLISLWLTTYADDWPCQRWPATWADDRQAWLDDYAAAAATHPTSRHRRSRSNVSVLRDALERCPKDSDALTGRDVGKIRRAVAAAVARWGKPGSARATELRKRQQIEASRPTHQAIAAVVAERLEAFPNAAGVPDLEPVLEAVSLPPSNEPIEVPPSVEHKAMRAMEGQVDELVARDVIGSAEVLAEVLPQISSQIAAAGIDNADLQVLYGQVYRAFRRRRSLLLLNLERQVQIEELPWVAALDRFRTADQGTQRNAAKTLSHTALLAMTSFPQTILPNPFVRELASLADHAGLDIPFVEEIAADIFMGTFTIKWQEAARVSAELLDGTLYARYYDLPASAAWTPPPPTADGETSSGSDFRWGVGVASGFADLCQQRSAEAAAGDGSYTARNGAVIEQSQILTTHNLAPLVAALELTEQLGGLAPQLTGDVFAWIVGQQTTRRDDWRAQLQMVKNTAYGWRQAIFFLSLVDEATQREIIDGWWERWSGGSTDWQTRFEPALTGLERVFAGNRFDAGGHTGGGRRFLGWSIGPHWLNPSGRRRSEGRA